MKKFMFSYYGGGSKSEMATADHKMKEEMMEAWKAYGAGLGDALVDFGNPFGGATVVTADGTKEEEGDLKGFSVVQAEDQAAAVAMTEGHPHLTMPGGRIDVMEMIDMN